MGNVLLRLMGTGHAKLIKATGKLGGGTEDGSFLVLEHVGAKSGTKRETPLTFFNHDEGFLIVASMAGAPKNPGWYYNLKANPDVAITVDRKRIEVTADELDPAARAEQWKRILAHDPRWAKYETKTARVMPLLLLRPR